MVQQVKAFAAKHGLWDPHCSRSELTSKGCSLTPTQHSHTKFKNVVKFLKKVLLH